MVIYRASLNLIGQVLLEIIVHKYSYVVTILGLVYVE